jgi:hypothetical protein
MLAFSQLLCRHMQAFSEPLRHRMLPLGLPVQLAFAGE